MKITILLPFFGLSGGIKMLLEYAESLQKRGHTVHLYYPAIFPFPGQSMGSQCYRLAYTLKNVFLGGRVPWDVSVSVKRIWRVADSSLPDADIIIAGAWPSAFQIMPLSKSKGAKCYFIQHYEEWDGHKKMVDAAWKLPLHRIVIASWLQQLGKEKFGVESVVIPNGIKLEDFVCPSKPMPRPVKHIGMLMHPSKWKGTDDGLKACAIVHEKYPNMQFTFYGHFRDKRTPNWATQKVNLGTQALHEYFCNLDIYVHPAHKEGWGLPILEAMASKTAVAITDSLGPRDFTQHEKNALVSPPQKPEELAKNIIRLIEEPETRERLVSEGVKTAQQFSQENSVDELEKFLTSILKKNLPPTTYHLPTFRKPRIGYVIGNHTDGRDLRYCQKFSQSDVTFIGRIDDKDRALLSQTPHLSVIEPEYKKVIPDFLNRMSNGRYNITAWVYLKDLEKHLQDVDVIYTAGTYTSMGVQCARIAKKLHKPLVIFEWETLPHHLTSFLPPYALWTRKVSRTADLFITMTDRAKNYLSSLGVPEEKQVTVYPSVDISLFQAAKQHDDKKCRILFVGRLTREKGLQELLSAFKNVHAQFPHTELIICGRGEMEKDVRELSKNQPIVYKGFLDNRDLPNIFRSADLFCLPSRNRNIGPVTIWEEQFGFVFVEAMAAGLPIVTIDNGAIPEVVGKNNLIARQNDVDDLTQKLVQLTNDPQKRHALGAENRKRAESVFSDTKNIPRLESTILSVL